MPTSRRPARTTTQSPTWALAALTTAMALIALALMTAPRIAYADPPPRPKPGPTTTAPTPPTRPIPGPRGPMLPPPQPVQPPAAPAPPSEDKPKSNLLLDAILGKQGKLPGEYPLSHYDVGYSSGGLFGSFRPSAILGWLTDIVFTAARWLTAFALWAINYALAFGIARSLIDPAAHVATGYQHAVQHSGLTWVLLTLAIAYAGWHALRGRLAHGLGEAMVSFLIATLLAGILAAPATTLLGNNGLLDRTGDISLALAGVSLDPAHPSPQHGEPSTEISAPMLARLQHTLVGIPHQVLNWGDVLEGPDSKPQCLKTYRALLASGPWGDKDDPRDQMKAAGCADLAAFNKHGSADRLIAALLVLVAAILACALIALMAFTVIGAQIVLALLACFTPLALAAGLLPGGGRQVLWRWATAVLRTLASVIMTVAALSVVITLATAILRADADMPLAVRMGLLDIFMITAFLFRRRLLEAGRRAAVSLGNRLERVRIGGTSGHRGLMPAGSAVAAAEAWGQHHQRALGSRARHEIRQLAHARHTDHRVARTVRNANTSPDRAATKHAASTTGRAVHLTGKAVRFTGKTAGVALASTIGAPVYLPRAAKAAKALSSTKAEVVRKRLATAKRNADAFRREYVQGLTAPVRLVKSTIGSAEKRIDRDRAPTTPARRGPGKTPDNTTPKHAPASTPPQPPPPRRKPTSRTSTGNIPTGKDRATNQQPNRVDPARPRKRPQPSRTKRAATPPPPINRKKTQPPKRKPPSPPPPPHEQAD